MCVHVPGLGRVYVTAGQAEVFHVEACPFSKLRGAGLFYYLLIFFNFYLGKFIF